MAAALVVAGVLFRQAKEMDRLRGAIAELKNLPTEGAAVSTITNPLPTEVEELRREFAEVHRLRAELTQEKVERSALQARVDKLIMDLNQRSDYIAVFDRPASRPSPLALQASSLAQSSPEEAARWVAALPPGKEQDQAALAVIDHWMGTNPVAAAVWTTGFMEGPLREQAMSAVAREWGLHDWNATADWLETLPMGASRDAAIEAFVMSADGYDIALALEWANQMEVPESRTMQVERTARRWLREDSAAARAWLEKAELPPGIAERLLSAK
jgi:hypothetical protein